MAEAHDNEAVKYCTVLLHGVTGGSKATWGWAGLLGRAPEFMWFRQLSAAHTAPPSSTGVFWRPDLTHATSAAEPNMRTFSAIRDP